MSDKETLIAMFQRAGIKFIDRPVEFHPSAPVTSTIDVEDGYAGLASFEFDDAGALKRVSAWE